MCEGSKARGWRRMFYQGMQLVTERSDLVCYVSSSSRPRSRRVTQMQAASRQPKLKPAMTR